MIQWLKNLFRKSPEKIDLPEDWPFDHYDRPVGYPPRSKPTDYAPKPKPQDV